MAKKVFTPPIQLRPPQTLNGVITYLSDYTRSVFQAFNEIGFRINDVLPKDGTEQMEAPLPLQTVTAAQVGSLGLIAGEMVYVSDAAPGALPAIAVGTAGGVRYIKLVNSGDL